MSGHVLPHPSIYFFLKIYLGIIYLKIFGQNKRKIWRRRALNKTTTLIATQNSIYIKGKHAKHTFLNLRIRCRKHRRKKTSNNIPFSQLYMHSTLHCNPFPVSRHNKLFLSMMVAEKWCCQRWAIWRPSSSPSLSLCRWLRHEWVLRLKPYAPWVLG